MLEGHDAFRFEAVGFLLECVYDLAVKVEAAVHVGVVLCLSVGAKLYVSPWQASGQASLRVWKPRQKCGTVICATSGIHDAFRSALSGVHLGRLARYAGVGVTLSRPRWGLGLLLIISLNSLEGTLGHPCGLCTKHYTACLY